MSSNLEDVVLLIRSSDQSIPKFGTGFAIYRDEHATYVVTSAHVIRDVGGVDKVTAGGSDAKVIAMGSQDGLEGIDLAILRVEGLPNIFPILSLSASAQKDKEVAIPGIQSILLQKQTRSLIEIRTLIGIVVSPIKVGLPEAKLTRAWDIKITSEFFLAPGYSGAPLIDEVNNVVIGIVTSMRDGGRKGTALPSEALKEIWPEEIPISLFTKGPHLLFVDGNLTLSASNLVSPLPAFNPQWLKELDVSGGAVPLDSQFYVERQEDSAAKEQVLRSGVTIRITGSRQVGKTSLLARLLQHADEHAYPYSYIDFQEMEEDHFSSLDTLLYYFAYRIGDEHHTNQNPDAYWQGQMKAVGPKDKITQFLRKEVLLREDRPFLLVLDEVDRLFQYKVFRDDFFGLIRSWHNKRAMPNFPEWKYLNIVLTYSTEVFLFITDLNQSPFNVGTLFNLRDFDRAQVELVNYKHGSPVKTAQEMDSLMILLHGHPFLVRKAWYTLAVHRLTVEDLLQRARNEDGPFGEHLQHYLLQLQKNKELASGMKLVIQSHTCATDLLFYQLRSMGLVTGSSRTNVQPRCGLYAQYFQEHL